MEWRHYVGDSEMAIELPLQEQVKGNVKSDDIAFCVVSIEFPQEMSSVQDFFHRTHDPVDRQSYSCYNISPRR